MIRFNDVTRWLLLLPALLVILGSWFVVRWYVGDTVAEYAPTVEEGGIEMARLAVRWAPADPLTHWRLGILEEKVFSAENMAAAVREYQLAVMVSPTDYRYWMELGRALEANGDREGAEKALRRAVELAPAYSYPRWRFGNLLLREGKVDEAFENLSRAADSDELMRPQVFTLAWQAFSGDLNAVMKAVPAPAVRMQFAIYLINGGSIDEAARLIRSISPSDRQAQSALTKEVVKSLIQKKHFHAALDILRELEPDVAQLPVPGQVWNGGFETKVAPSDPKDFHWIFTSRQAEISKDTQAHSGQGSLRIVFRTVNKMDGVLFSQNVIVEPDTQYRLECYVRTDSVISASTPLLAINDATDNNTLVTSSQLPTGSSDWKRITLDFKTKPKSDGITILLYRPPCSEAQICPIFGTVWYDDFSLQRIAGPGSPRGESGSAKH
jgi:tetratricopeptide (TPR) repeat protein